MKTKYIYRHKNSKFKKKFRDFEDIKISKF